jgi:hypothetical protein
MKHKKRTNVRLKKLAALTVALAFAFALPVSPARAAEAPASASNGLDSLQKAIENYGNEYKFEEYLADHAASPRPNAEYVINAADFTRAEGMDVLYYDNFEGVPGVSLWTDETGLVEWAVDIAESGMYHISLQYYSIPGKSSDVQRSVFIDGALPFLEASTVEFRRTWVNELAEIQADNRGNELRPTQIEQNRWRESILEDPMGS